MYNALNEQLVLQQAAELRRELQAGRYNRGARRWWRRERSGDDAGTTGRRTR